MKQISWKGLSCLVTGGAGFIGSHVVDALLRRGARVKVLDNLSRGSIDNLEHCLNQLEFVQADALCFDSCVQALRDVDVCFHLAAVVGGVDVMTNHPAEMWKNMSIDRSVVEACRRNDVDRMLYTSTACTYPTIHQKSCDYLPLKESDVSIYGVQPDSVYGWSKLLGEIMCKAYHEKYGMKISIVRPFNPYGPRDYFDPDSSHVIPSLIRKALFEQGPLVVWGSGQQSRAFQYVCDVAEAFPLAVEKIVMADPINLGSSEDITIADLAKLILLLTSREDKHIVFDTSKPEGVKVRRADTSKASNVLGWQTKVPLREGLRRTIDWYRSRKNI